MICAFLRKGGSIFFVRSCLLSLYFNLKVILSKLPRNENSVSIYLWAKRFVAFWFLNFSPKKNIKRGVACFKLKFVSEY